MFVFAINTAQLLHKWLVRLYLLLELAQLCFYPPHFCLQHSLAFPLLLYLLEHELAHHILPLHLHYDCVQLLVQYCDLSAHLQVSLNQHLPALESTLPNHLVFDDRFDVSNLLIAKNKKEVVSREQLERYLVPWFEDEDNSALVVDVDILVINYHVFGIVLERDGSQQKVDELFK